MKIFSFFNKYRNNYFLSFGIVRNTGEKNIIRIKVGAFSDIKFVFGLKEKTLQTNSLSFSLTEIKETKFNKEMVVKIVKVDSGIFAGKLGKKTLNNFVVKRINNKSIESIENLKKSYSLTL